MKDWCSLNYILKCNITKQNTRKRTGLSMGIISKFESKMEDGIEGAAGMVGGSGLSPVQITKKAEKQMRREKIVGAGKQYAPTLYTVLVSVEDDARLSNYYPTLAGETETYLMARARETGYVMDGHPLVRFLADPELKRGKFDVVAEMVASNIIQQLRDDEMRRYGMAPRSQAANNQGAAANPRSKQVQPNMQPLPNLEKAREEQEVQAQARQAMMEQKRKQAELLAQQQRLQAAQAAQAAQQQAQMQVQQPQMPAQMPQQIHQQQAQPVSGRGLDAIFDDGLDYAVVEQALDNSNREPNTVNFAANELQVYLYDEARDTAYNLTGAVQTIGRESSNDIVVPDINISRVHAQICRMPDGTWTVTDLNSTNGLYVNGKQVQSIPLRDADMITLGTSTLEFQQLS